MSLSPLLPDRHPQMIFFTADIFDNLPVKDDTASMEHPVYSLSTKRDLRALEYENNGVSVKISPSYDHGLPTIFDKDILLYCGSILMEQINIAIRKAETLGRETYTLPPKTIRFSAHDLLVTTNRPTCGNGYRRLKEAFDRLTSCYITTNIKTNKRNIHKGFHILENFDVIEKSSVNRRMVRLEVTLSDWFYNSFIGMEVLTINRKYFQLRKPIERRIYELARKHCGSQVKFKISIDKLHEKTGSISPLKNFRFYLRKIIETNHLPDYQLYLADNDVVHVTYTPDDKTKARSLMDEITPENTPRIKPATIERARNLTREAGTGWDFYVLQEQFTIELQKGFKPKSVDGAFMEFIKKKIKKCA